MVLHEENQCYGGGIMSSENVMRNWYTPLEISTLKNWLNAAIVVNILLLVIDWLRDDVQGLQLGLVLSQD